MAASTSGIRVSPLSAGGKEGCAFERESVEKIFRAVMCDELKQLSGVTSATSSGSANVMSTHYRPELVHLFLPSPYQDGSPQLQTHVI